MFFVPTSSIAVIFFRKESCWRCSSTTRSPKPPIVRADGPVTNRSQKCDPDGLLKRASNALTDRHPPSSAQIWCGYGGARARPPRQTRQPDPILNCTKSTKPFLLLPPPSNHSRAQALTVRHPCFPSSPSVPIHRRRCHPVHPPPPPQRLHRCSPWVSHPWLHRASWRTSPRCWKT